MRIPVVAPLVAALLLTAGMAKASVDAADAPADDESPPSGRYLLMDANGRAITNADFPGQFQLICGQPARWPRGTPRPGATSMHV